ncbi:MAG: allantoate amidohydrolase [Ktedonobacteraceae bacterium]
MALDLSARSVMERCELLSHFSEEADCLTRRFATPPMREVNATVAGWMRTAGMSVQIDAIGNIIGRYEAAVPDAKTLLLGSHLDTVRAAGKYDGPLGVMVALACVERLHLRGERLPFAIEVLGFADEEGLRYHTAYIGSRAVAGIFDGATLTLHDEGGVTLAEAIRQSGGNPELEVLRRPRWRREELLGYCEVHIEQGPVLEARGLPVGIVSAISGQNRYALTFVGKAGHAGTVPMQLRRDALCAVAEFVLATEAVARSTPGLVATVGMLTVHPGASNVIPGRVTISLDVRYPDAAVLEQACDQLATKGKQISQERGIEINWHTVQKDQTIPCDPHLVRMMQQAIESSGYATFMLPSGAGHDGVSLSKITTIAMLFVRCKGGISHHPDESVSVEDVGVVLDVMDQFLQGLRRETETGGV